MKKKRYRVFFTIAASPKLFSWDVTATSIEEAEQKFKHMLSGNSTKEIYETREL